jgi:hypothetical protein
MVGADRRIKILQEPDYSRRLAIEVSSQDHGADKQFQSQTPRQPP